ncbi:MAG: hypothetical protein HYY65_08700 [Candidatus Tectomicrobia bacterium]|uniref:Uncharacterized protein n=1 Tax=Tectimicrobiota bacterium TaxID=2528274 RepID=A0A932GQ57_UNCTE|nr:hypothetical protein [Candidatus Tectomicrobia bacterium]
MRLVIFHKILIGTAVLFGLGFSGWEFLSYRRTGHVEDLVISVSAVMISAALGYYLRNLKRFLALP